MEKKYINETRYKKGATRKRRDASTVRNNLKSKRQVEKQIETNTKVLEKKVPKKIVKKHKVKNKLSKNKGINVFICVLLIVSVAIISRLLLKEKDEPFIALPFGERENANEQVIKIGVITTQSLLDENISNVVINEINKYYKDMLITINSDYSIDYRVISSVNKVSNKEYIITRNNNYGISIQEIKNVIDKYSSNEQSVYYAKLNNIESVTVIDKENINIKLKTDDPYFVYNLDVPCGTSSNTNYVKTSSTEDTLVLNRSSKAKKNLPLKIVINRYKDVYRAVEAYKERKINCFVTNAENVQTLLGKYEYNILSYRNGKCVFLFGNPNSKLFSNLEVRQVLAYSINRDGIIKSILKSKGEKIDLPYIYDNVKYKYDIYAAENILLTNGYTKSNNIYSKKENGINIRLELDLLVNREDEVKVNIAKEIKKDLEAIGIKINVEELTEKKLQTRISKGEYDLVLANVNLNNNPNISFIKNNLFVSEDVKQALISVEDEIIEQQVKNINTLQKLLSDNISTIGIYSDNSYLIYNKEIQLNNIRYMDLFISILK